MYRWWGWGTNPHLRRRQQRQPRSSPSHPSYRGPRTVSLCPAVGPLPLRPMLGRKPREVRRTPRRPEYPVPCSSFVHLLILAKEVSTRLFKDRYSFSAPVLEFTRAPRSRRGRNWIGLSGLSFNAAAASRSLMQLYHVWGPVAGI